MECNDNEFCKNLDLYKSSPGKIVYRCPTSTCSAGTCNCASPCFRDFTTGTCVRPMDTIPPFIPPGTLPPPITNRPVHGPVSMPTQAPLVSIKPGTLPPPITNRPVHGPVSMPTQAPLVSIKPGTLPPPITNRPVRGPVSMPTQAPLVSIKPGTLPPPITNRPVHGPVSMPTQAPLPGVSKPPTGVCLRTTIGNNVCWRIDGRNIVNCDCKDVRSSIVYNVSSFNSDVKQLAPSEIAGIVIGSLAGFAILVFLILLLKKNSKVPKP